MTAMRSEIALASFQHSAQAAHHLMTLYGQQSSASRQKNCGEVSGGGQEATDGRQVVGAL